MIEITTGVVFLMTSLYGSEHAATQAATAVMAGKVANAAEQTEEIATSESRSFTVSKELESYLRKEYADTPILVDIARCESTFRHYGENGDIIRGRVNKNDVGVMQINEYYHGETAKKMGIDLHTVDGNIEFAKYLYGKYGTSPWKASSPCWSASAELAKN